MLSPPDSNRRIVNAAWLAARGKLPGAPRTPGKCLAFVRVVVEYALGWHSHDLYADYLVAGTTRRPGSDAERLEEARADPWASDMEASCKQLGWAVPKAERLPGDLVFNHAAAIPYGHIGVLLDESTVLELIDAQYRPGSLHLPGSLALTPLESRSWSLVARIGGEEGIH